MRILVAAVGRLKSGPERELADRYLQRVASAGRVRGVRSVEVFETEESRAREMSLRIKEETARISAAVSQATALVVLDPGGEALASEHLAARLGSWLDGGCPALAFAIGGPDGLGDCGRRPDLVLSFGRATWPHQLVRIMLLEQLYRAMTILSGHPYHRN